MTKQYFLLLLLVVCSCKTSLKINNEQSKNFNNSKLHKLPLTLTFSKKSLVPDSVQDFVKAYFITRGATLVSVDEALEIQKLATEKQFMDMHNNGYSIGKIMKEVGENPDIYYNKLYLKLFLREQKIDSATFHFFTHSYTKIPVQTTLKLKNNQLFNGLKEMVDSVIISKYFR